VAQLDPLRAIPILRESGSGREPELGRVHAAMEALCGISSPAGSCVWHVGLQRSVREWAIRQGWVAGRCATSRRRASWWRRWGCWRGRADVAAAAERRNMRGRAASTFLGRLEVAELHQEQQVIADLEDAADEQRPGPE
jgi:hypothetical protein